MRRHIDVLAVFLITVGLLAISQAPIFQIPAQSLQFTNVRSSTSECPLLNFWNR